MNNAGDSLIGFRNLFADSYLGIPQLVPLINTVPRTDLPSFAIKQQ